MDADDKGTEDKVPKSLRKKTNNDNRWLTKNVGFLNGRCETIEAGMEILGQLAPEMQIAASGSPVPFPPDLDENPLRNHVPDYPAFSLELGVTDTFHAFKTLVANGQVTNLPA